jgi:glycosyltransferase involved in cell wall biosynthesis
MQDIDPEYLNQFEGVVYHGTVGKAELAELQKRAKIWVYPNLGYLDSDYTNFKETFCITAVENGLAGNAIISSAIGGLVDTLDGYWLCEKFINNSDEFTNGAIIDDLDEYATYLASEAVVCLTNQSRQSYLASRARTTCSKYTWEESANTWLREWKLID